MCGVLAWTRARVLACSPHKTVLLKSYDNVTRLTASRTGNVAWGYCSQHWLSKAPYTLAPLFWQAFLVKENLPLCRGPLVKLSLVESHLMESWRASFSTKSEGKLMCVHTGESRCQARRELVKDNLPGCTGLSFWLSGGPWCVPKTYNGHRNILRL